MSFGAAYSHLVVVADEVVVDTNNNVVDGKDETDNAWDYFPVPG